MPEITDADRQRLQAELEREFPGDLMMQELHMIRRLRYERVKHLPLREQLRQLAFGIGTQLAQRASAKG